MVQGPLCVRKRNKCAGLSESFLTSFVSLPLTKTKSKGTAAFIFFFLTLNSTFYL